MTKAIKKNTIHAGGIDIGIYTTDFKNEYISLTDIAKYRSIQPSITIMLNVVLFGKTARFSCTSVECIRFGEFGGFAAVARY